VKENAGEDTGMKKPCKKIDVTKRDVVADQRTSVCDDDPFRNSLYEFFLGFHLGNSAKQGINT